MKTLKGIFGGGVKENESNNEHGVVQYRCPMKCEGEKTYDAPGNCPVCNMKLVPISDSGSPSQVHEHGHKGHGHGHHGCC